MNDARNNAISIHETTQLAEGVYAYVQPEGGWCLNNAGILLGTKATVLVDTAATETRARALRDEVATLGGRPPEIVVNTHSHGDHTFGNHLFAEHAAIVAHRRAASEMAEHGLILKTLWPAVDWGHIELSLPTVTFDHAMSLPTAGLRIELLHLGPGHTGGDAVVWLPDQRILFTGDLVFSGTTPFVLMGSVSGSLLVLDRLRALEPRHVVPGHGPVGGPELLDTNADYLRWVNALAQDGLAHGLTALQAAGTAGSGPFAALLESERLVGNLVRAYAEMGGLAPAGAVDVQAAFQDMVTLHGGPLHCDA